jgi:hypothetical protein
VLEGLSRKFLLKQIDAISIPGLRATSWPKMLEGWKGVLAALGCTMLQPPAFRLIAVHAVIYTPGLAFRSSRALTYFLGRYGDLYSGSPTTLPLPQEMSEELPRIVLQSEDGRHRLQVGPARLEVTRDDEAMPADELPKFLEFATDLCIGYLHEMRGEASRLACVVRRFMQDDTAAKDVATHFCRDEWLADPLKRPSDFELHAAKQYEFAGWLKINSWFRCKSVTLIPPNKDSVAGVLVEQDFNTLRSEPDKERVFTPEEIHRFFHEAPAEFQNVLDRYFPTKRQANA